MILEANKIYVEKLSLPDVQQLTYSTSKNTNTFKVSVVISSFGAITFISDVCHGSISDNVMADCGFKIQDDLSPLSVKLNMTPFYKGKASLIPIKR